MVPVHLRAAGLARLLAALPAHLAVVVVDDASPDPAPWPRSRRPTARACCATSRTGAPRPPATAAWPRSRPRCVAFCDSDVVPEPGWLGTLRRHLDDPAVALAAPRVLGPVARADRRRCGALRAGVQLARPRPAGGPGAGPAAACRTCPAPACWPASTPSVTGSTSGCAPARTSTSCGAWSPPAGGCATTRRRRCGTSTARRTPRGGAARRSTARRRRTSPRGTARRSPRWCSAPGPVAGRCRAGPAPLVAARGRRAARPWPTVATARRLREDGRWRTAAAVTARGAGGTLTQSARSLLRHHWPAWLLVATRSRRVRRACSSRPSSRACSSGAGSARGSTRRVPAAAPRSTTSPTAPGCGVEPGGPLGRALVPPGRLPAARAVIGVTGAVRRFAASARTDQEASMAQHELHTRKVETPAGLDVVRGARRRRRSRWSAPRS